MALSSRFSWLSAALHRQPHPEQGPFAQVLRQCQGDSRPSQRHFQIQCSEHGVLMAPTPQSNESRCEGRHHGSERAVSTEGSPCSATDVYLQEEGCSPRSEVPTPKLSLKRGLTEAVSIGCCQGRVFPLGSKPRSPGNQGGVEEP